jgi:PadR family transcriptional regulator PadR
VAKTELIKGSTEIIILSLLQTKDRYGYELAQEINRLSEGYLQFKEGTLYPALKRLELAELVVSYWQSSPEGPRRKYYALTGEGERVLAANKKEWATFQKVMRRFLGGEPLYARI